MQKFIGFKMKSTTCHIFSKDDISPRLYKTYGTALHVLPLGDTLIFFTSILLSDASLPIIHQSKNINNGSASVISPDIFAGFLPLITEVSRSVRMNFESAAQLFLHLNQPS